MAQQNNGYGTVCGGLLALLAMGFVLASWQIFLIAAVLVAAIAAVVDAVLLYNQPQPAGGGQYPLDPQLRFRAAV